MSRGALKALTVLKVVAGIVALFLVVCIGIVAWETVGFEPFRRLIAKPPRPPITEQPPRPPPAPNPAETPRPPAEPAAKREEVKPPPPPRLQAGGSFQWQGVEWRVPDQRCVVHDAALRMIEEGFELAADDELSDLSGFLRSPAGSDARARFPFLSQSDATVWSNRRDSITNRRGVVRLSDGARLSQVPASCAHLLLRKRRAPQ
jgi:hypothetical protein